MTSRSSASSSTRCSFMLAPMPAARSSSRKLKNIGFHTARWGQRGTTKLTFFNRLAALETQAVRTSSHPDHSCKARQDRKSVVSEKRVSVRLDLGGSNINKK